MSSAGQTAADILEISRIPSGEQRIFGGTTARRGQYPYYASFQDITGHHICGASLIHPHWALSAAHCPSPNTLAKNFRVVVSAFEKDVVDPKDEEVRVLSQIVQHPQFNESHSTYDYGLLKFDQAITKVMPVRLLDATSHSVSGGGRSPLPLTIIGLGRVKENTKATHLQQAVVTYLNSTECRDEIRPFLRFLRPGLRFENFTFPDIWLCAASTEASTCLGDSGGPLLHESIPSSDVLHQIGVSSFIAGTSCRANTLNVFAAINSDILQFINTTIESHPVAPSSSGIKYTGVAIAVPIAVAVSIGGVVFLALLWCCCRRGRDRAPDDNMRSPETASEEDDDNDDANDTENSPYGTKTLP